MRMLEFTSVVEINNKVHLIPVTLIGEQIESFQPTKECVIKGSKLENANSTRICTVNDTICVTDTYIEVQAKVMSVCIGSAE